MKVEDQSSRQVKDLERQVEAVLNVVPAEHLRGLRKIVFVDEINEPRITAVMRSQLPGLYHPRQGGQMAWAEIALSVLNPKKKFPQSVLAKMTLKPNIAQMVLSLIAQHYYLTLSKGVKKTQLERECRLYAQKYFERWRETQGGLRMKLTKPFRPFLDRMARRLGQKYKEEMERKRAQP